MTSSDAQNLLGAYLNDHLAGATGGSALARRIARTHEDDEAGPLHRLAADVEEDRTALLSQMERLGVRPRPDKALLARVAEVLGRAKPNGSLLHRTPLTPVFELEMMALGVVGKAAGWRSLLAVAARDERLDSSELENLVARAEAQVATLEALRVRAADVCFDA
jgi:hypothetical protein